MIAIIDYKAGNLMSVSNALLRIGADFQVTWKREVRGPGRCGDFSRGWSRRVGHAGP